MVFLFYIYKEEKDMEFKMATKKDAEQIYELVQETIRVVYPKYYLNFVSEKRIRNIYYEPAGRDNRREL